MHKDKLALSNNFLFTDGMVGFNPKCPPLPSQQDECKHPRLFHIKCHKVDILHPANTEKPLSSQDMDCLTISKQDYINPCQSLNEIMYLALVKHDSPVSRGSSLFPHNASKGVTQPLDMPFSAAPASMTAVAFWLGLTVATSWQGEKRVVWMMQTTCYIYMSK